MALLEAICKAGHTFTPADKDDTIHIATDDGPCGQPGVITGAWYSPGEQRYDWVDRDYTDEELQILATARSYPIHTLREHEKEMPNCSDPDCEFHHPEVREN